jgi:hypothetical protein
LINEEELRQVRFWNFRVSLSIFVHASIFLHQFYLFDEFLYFLLLDDYILLCQNI